MGQFMCIMPSIYLSVCSDGFFVYKRARKIKFMQLVFPIFWTGINANGNLFLLQGLIKVSTCL